MANLKSSIKRIRKDRYRRIINKKNLSISRTYIKKFMSYINSCNLDLVKSFYPIVMSMIDKSVSKNVFHKNKANRLKSRLSCKIKKIGM